MNSLITSNLAHHPVRTATGVMGIATGFVLVILTAGLVRGMLRDRGIRDANTGVEILVYHREQAGISMTSLPMTLPTTRSNELSGISGAASVTPVGQHLEMKGESGLGLRQIDGVDFESYTRTTRIRVIEGSPLPSAGDFVIVDVRYAADHNAKPGQIMRIFDRDFTIVGIYAPETGSRMMIPLSTLQSELGAPDRCSMFLVKCADPSKAEAVARRIVEEHPDFRIIFTSDLPRLFADGYSGFNTFLRIVAGLAAVISLLVILLTMYTTVMERTRQIGILKSLGASKSYITRVFIIESLLITGIGVVTGLIIALLARRLMVDGFGIAIEIEPKYTVLVICGGLISGLIGALYPALQAASRDPVEALSYE